MKKVNTHLFFIAFIFILSTSIPYIWGIVTTPGNGTFIGFTRNIDDMAVYMTWIKQITDNNFITHNLFQPNIGGFQINIYFIILGYIAKIFKISPGIILHIFAVLQNILLIYMFWIFSGLFLKSNKNKIMALLCFLFSGGIGYFFPNLNSIDIWQPEAITFMSAYLNPLFTISLILMMYTLYNVIKFKEELQIKYLIHSGMALFLLGNIHTYDTVIIVLLWICFTIYTAITNGSKINARSYIISNSIAIILGSLSILANYIIYKNDAIYKLRADTIISTPNILLVLAGFGILFLLSVLALLLIKNKKIDIKHAGLIVFWLVLGLIIIYIPFSQQRKFIMGYQIPLALLGGTSLYYIGSILKNRLYESLFVILSIVIISMTNVSNMAKDMSELSQMKTATHYSPYLSYDELDILHFLNENYNGKDVCVWTTPQLALFIPSYSNISVYYGHWSETPNYEERLQDYINFVTNKDNNIYGNLYIFDTEIKDRFSTLYPKKKLIYENKGFVIFK